jgi:co-chaperonin GroES (HSP10)
MEVIDNRSTFTIRDERVKLIEAERVYDAPKPILGGVLISRNPTESIFAGTSFVIPHTARKQANKGVVVAVGPDAAATCTPGDVVTFTVYNSEDVDVDGETFALVDFHDIKLVEKVTYIAPTH